MLLLKFGLHPPLALTVASHVENAASIAACVRLAAVVKLVGQVNDTAEAAVTVNLAVQVEIVGAQVLVYVNVTTFEPPHLSGPAVPPSLLRDPLHPPLEVAVANHVVNAASTCACV